MADRIAAALVALADPTRRAIFERVAREPVSVGEIARTLPVSRPAVSQHLKQLKNAGLVIDTAQGTRRIYALDPRGIGAMRDWLEGFWAHALTSFQAFADASTEGAERHDDPDDMTDKEDET
jgi:DNA-binding transcriptional ArsR family regulator